MINKFIYTDDLELGLNNPLYAPILDSREKSDEEIIEYLEYFADETHYHYSILYHYLSRKVKLYIKMRGYKIDC